jgi:hypothetical protein
MTGMIERVARTICRLEHELVFGTEDWRQGELERKVDGYWRAHILAARAAIEATPRRPYAAPEAISALNSPYSAGS